MTTNLKIVEQVEQVDNDMDARMRKVAQRWIEKNNLINSLSVEDILADKQIKDWLTKEVNMKIAEEKRLAKYREVQAKKKALEKLRQDMQREHAEKQKRRQDAQRILENKHVVNLEMLAKLHKMYADRLPECVFESAEQAASIRRELCNRATHFQKTCAIRKNNLFLSALIDLINIIMIKGFGFFNEHEVRSYRASNWRRKDAKNTLINFSKTMALLLTTDKEIEVVEDDGDDQKPKKEQVEHTKLACPECDLTPQGNFKRHRSIFFYTIDPETGSLVNPDNGYTKDKGDLKKRMLEGFNDGLMCACNSCRRRIVNALRKEDREAKKKERSEADRKRTELTQGTSDGTGRTGADTNKGKSKK